MSAASAAGLRSVWSICNNPAKWPAHCGFWSVVSSGLKYEERKKYKFKYKATQKLVSYQTSSWLRKSLRDIWAKMWRKKLCTFKTCFYIHSKSIISIANRSFVANAGCLFTFILQSTKLFSLARYQISQLFSLAKYAAAHNNPAYTFPKSCLFSLH